MEWDEGNDGVWRYLFRYWVFPIIQKYQEFRTYHNNSKCKAQARPGPHSSSNPTPTAAEV